MKDLKLVSAFSTRIYSALPASLRKTTDSMSKICVVSKGTLDLSTLLTLGMCLQTFAFYLCPRYLAAAPAALFLVYKLLYLFPSTKAENGFLSDKLLKWSASVPNLDGSIPEQAATNGVICFVVGSQLNQSVYRQCVGLGPG